jgi:transcription initiation factor IIE alpha subunit
MMAFILYKFICKNKHITILFEEDIKENEIICKNCGEKVEKETAERKIIINEMGHLLGD